MRDLALNDGGNQGLFQAVGSARVANDLRASRHRQGRGTSDVLSPPAISFAMRGSGRFSKRVRVVGELVWLNEATCHRRSMTAAKCPVTLLLNQCSTMSRRTQQTMIVGQTARPSAEMSGARHGQIELCSFIGCKMTTPASLLEHR